ncbi:MAG TPA: Fe-S cluster assembly protein HesB [Nocardioides sp.]|jgi:Fe-S cluster assembly iron-binding protein IscA
MLTLTENASTIVKDLTAQTGANETAGLRISAADAAGPALAVTAAPQPQPGDQVVEQNGATVYLDELAATQLEDKVLDAGVDETGNVQFSLAEQA